MSVRTQIDRLSGNVSAALNAISKKGVTVPAGANSDDLEGLISDIPNGVELPTLENPGTASDLAEGKQLIDADGNVVDGTYVPLDTSDATATAGRILRGDTAYVNGKKITGTLSFYPDGSGTTTIASYADSVGKSSVYPSTHIDVTRALPYEYAFLNGSKVKLMVPYSEFGNAKPSDVRQGVTFTSAAGFLARGEALLPGGGSVYPEGAFAPVTNFTDGKQYALVAVIDGVYRFINTTTYNDYTMNATQINIAEDAGDYVIFSATPVLFTAVASGDGFLLQNGSNYLHGTSSGGTALRVGTTQAVWTVDDSATGGFSDGKYYAKEDPNAVWLMNVTGGYNWGIKFETAGSFGYDRDGRDGTYSTGFVSLVLYEYVAGEGEVNPIVDTSDATAKANDIVAGEIAYVNGRRIEGNVREINADADYYVDDEFGVNGKMISDVTASATFPMDQDTLFRKGTNVEFRFPVRQLGISGGSVIKTGTTTSGTIATGLSDIEQFFIYKESQTGTGLIHLHYTKTATSRMYASAWSTQSYGTKTITNGTDGVTVSGGTLTISATQAAQGALTSGVTYKWVAIGKE